ncbi:sensor histidine kinase [Sphingobacterium athyrii]|uniref:Histidine kinase n=1 Tax=Sphingobacterium athyrii TaxID=2152717 RepID=A0A363NQS0_9SPHI|nr:sensor histidine kinase [Sphingobacterium athyrii]PUV23155.1 histidine kinase [Sphingobacterium athyrii]
MKKAPFKAIIQAILASMVICIYFGIVAKLDHKDTPWLSIILHPNMARGLSYGFILFLGNNYLSKWATKKYPANKDFGKKMVFIYTGSIILTILVVFIVNAFFSDLFIVNSSKNFSKRFYNFVGQQHIVYYFQIAVSSLFISMVFFGFYFYKKFKDYQIKESEQEKQQITAQFESLKNQLDPHFLFNSLNVLNGLIEEDPKKASLFTTDLSRIYRYVLEHKDKSLVSLQEELSFSKAYLNLLNLRFEAGIQIDLHIHEDEISGLILPLSLQLLIENVIKHNVISLKSPLFLKIYRKNNYLYIENNLQKKKVLNGNSGIGLKNIQERYALLSSLPVYIHESDDLFSVGLPIIPETVL